MTKIAKEHLEALLELSEAVDQLKFAPPVAVWYNPLTYARAGAKLFIERYSRPAPFLLIGMNPGPWGMAQTGIPFGEINAVRDWLGIEAEIGQPSLVHPKRPITGFSTTRSEVSGRRLWGFFKNLYQSPEAFFSDFQVVNYCPLVFMEDSGRNLTPDKLPKAIKQVLFSACDQYLQRLARLIQPKWVIGVGVFASQRAQEALGSSYQYLSLPHPSPANPQANRGWDELAKQCLKPLGALPRLT